MSSSIVIVGAGLGGLVLARTLYRLGIPAVVFEAEASDAVRGQGGLLDIHPGTGQSALRDAGLLEAFRPLLREGHDAKRIVDRDGNVVFDWPGDDFGARPEVDRGELRRMLIRSLPAETIRWGCKVAGVLAGPGQALEIQLHDGSSREAQIVVGADGAWSKVRRCVSGVEPTYTGTCFIDIGSKTSQTLSVRSAETIGRGTLMAVAPGQAILAHRNTSDSFSGYVALNIPIERVASLGNDEMGLRELLEQRFESWSPALSTLAVDNLVDPQLRPIYALPVAHQWNRVPNVTLIGDAAHLMSPFAGEGANLAMYDGAALAHQIVAHPSDTDGALAAYEEALFARSADAAQRSADNLRRFLGPDAPHSAADMFARLLVRTPGGGVKPE